MDVFIEYTISQLREYFYLCSEASDMFLQARLNNPFSMRRFSTLHKLFQSFIRNFVYRCFVVREQFAKSEFTEAVFPTRDF